MISGAGLNTLDSECMQNWRERQLGRFFAVVVVVLGFVASISVAVLL